MSGVPGILGSGHYQPFACFHSYFSWVLLLLFANFFDCFTSLGLPRSPVVLPFSAFSRFLFANALFTLHAQRQRPGVPGALENCLKYLYTKQASLGYLRLFG